MWRAGPPRIFASPSDPAWLRTVPWSPPPPNIADPRNERPSIVSATRLPVQDSGRVATGGSSPERRYGAGSGSPTERSPLWPDDGGGSTAHRRTRIAKIRRLHRKRIRQKEPLRIESLQEVRAFASHNRSIPHRPTKSCRSKR
jgi:hypothetical protein